MDEDDIDTAHHHNSSQQADEVDVLPIPQRTYHVDEQDVGLGQHHRYSCIWTHEDTRVENVV